MTRLIDEAPESDTAQLRRENQSLPSEQFAYLYSKEDTNIVTLSEGLCTC